MNEKYYYYAGSCEKVEVIEDLGKGRYRYKKSCPKCHGTGEIGAYMHHDNGFCYRCTGKGYEIKEGKLYSLKEVEKRIEKYKKEKAKKEEEYFFYKEIRELKEMERAKQEMMYRLGIKNEEDTLYVIVDKYSYYKQSELRDLGYMFEGGYWIGSKKYIGLNYLETTFEELWNKEKCFLTVYDYVYIHENKSKHVGEIGDKINIEATLYNNIPIDTQWGKKYIVVFSDSQGNEYKWITGKSYNEGRVVLKGTVKSHSEYNNIKQTVLTRCNIYNLNKNQ